MAANFRHIILPLLSRTPVLSLALFLLNAWICRELFTLEYSQFMDSIEAAYIGLSRWILENPFEWDWFPLWYGGIPFQNAYPPLLHFIVAAVSAISGISTALSHHAVSAVFYCLGPVTLFWFAQQWSGRKWPAFAAGLLYSLISPSALLIPEVIRDLGTVLGPRRLYALVRYGEGPHIASMTLLPLALLALHWALRERRPLPVYAAVFGLAGVVLTNWLGAFALAAAVLCYLLVAWDEKWIRNSAAAAGIGLAAYMVAMPWIPPSTLADVRRNAQQVVGSYPMGIPQMLGGIALLAALGLMWRILRARRVNPVAQFGAYYTLLLGGMVLAWHWGGAYIMPQPGRYHLELEIGMILLLCFALAGLPGRWRTAAIAVLVVVAAAQTIGYSRYARRMIEPVAIESTVEYQAARQLSSRVPPGARVYVKGSTQFWWHAFSDNPQLGGGFDNGIANPLIAHIRFGLSFNSGDGELTLAWLRAFGIDGVVVGGEGTRDAFPDFKDPAKFERVLTEVWRDGGDVAYVVPRLRRSLAHVVPAAAVIRQELHGYKDPAGLDAYVAALEDPDLPAAGFEWLAPNRAAIRADVPPGHVVSVQVTHHDGWKAAVDGRSVPVRADGTGQIVMEPGCAGPCEIDLVYDGGTETAIAHLACAAGLAMPLLLLVPRRRWERLPWDRLRRPAGLLPASLVAVNAVVAGRFLFIEYIGDMSSVAGGHIAIIRWAAAHLTDLSWFPLWYTGIPMQNAYQPGLPVLAGALSAGLGVSAAAAYQIVTTLAYILGPLALYWFVAAFSRSKWIAFVAALFYSLFSPAVLLVPEIAVHTGAASGARRLQTLVSFGEGPHMLALALIPVALLVLWRALEKPSAGRILLAALGTASVALANWIGAAGFALAVLALLLAGSWKSVWKTWLTAAGIGVLAYALASPWLPPSTIGVVFSTSPQYSDRFDAGIFHLIFSLAVLAAAAALWWLLRRSAPSGFFRFACLFAILTGGVVVSYYGFQSALLPKAERYHLEFEMALAMLLAAVASLLWRRLRGAGARQVAVACAGIVCLVQLANYRSYAQNLDAGGDITRSIEYSVARWLENNRPGQRVHVTGSNRFWLNAFSEVPQLDGVSRHAVVNPAIGMVTYGIAFTEGDGERTAMWLRTYGVTSIVVSGPGGREVFREYRDPWKFEGVLPALWREGEDAIYDVPQRSPSLARVILPEHVVSRTPYNLEDTAPIEAYHEAIENEAYPVPDFRWESPHEAVAEAAMEPGQLLSVRIAHHPGWTATVDDREIPMRADGLGFIIAEPGCDGPCTVRLLYDGGTEMKVVRTLSGAALAVPLLLLLAGYIRRRP